MTEPGDGPSASGSAAAYPGGVPGPSTSPDRPSGAAFFDLDKTIIAHSSTMAFAGPFRAGGLINRRVVLRNAYAHFMYLVGGADHDQMERMREYLSRLVTGWDAQQVRDIVAETLDQMIQPMVYREATALIADHKAAGRDVVIVSGSGTEVVEPIGAMLGADRVVATRMVIEDGVYTGEIDFYAYGQNKAVAIRELAERNGYDLSASYAYSDSATDLPMLEAVGHPHAVNPDRALRREAATRGWPVLDFTHPITLRDRMDRVSGLVGERLPTFPPLPVLPSPPRPAMLGAAALAGGAVTIALVAARRRIRQAD